MDLRALAESILNKAKAKGADMAECRVMRSQLTEIDSAAGDIALARNVLSTDIAIKVIVDFKKESVNLNQIDEKSIDEALDEAFKNASDAKPDEHEGISDEKASIKTTTGSPEPDLDRLYTLLSELIINTKQEFPLVKLESATIQHTKTQRVYANTAGVAHETLTGYNGVSTMFSGSDGENSSSFNYFGIYVPDDCQNLMELDDVRRLLGEAERQIQTVSIGEAAIEDVLLSPECFAEFLHYTKALFLSDLPQINGTSPWKGKIGEKLASEKLSWKSSPRDPRLVVQSQLTQDGYVAEDNVLIKDGVLLNNALSRYGAKATGQERSANTGSMFIVEPGDQPLEAIIGSIQRGLLVNRFSGGNPAPNGDFSGVAKNAFLIEDGKVTKAVSETMISGNLANVLMNIEALSKELSSDGTRLMPWAHVKGISVTG